MQAQIQGHQALNRGDYLGAIRHLRAALDDADPISYDPLAYALQAVGRFADADRLKRRRSELEKSALPDSETVRVLADIERARGAASKTPRTEPAESSLDDAVPLLRRAVAGRRLVILNEEHHHPEHRAFGARILPLLRAAGVTHLALEANDQEPLDQAVQTGQVTPGTDAFAFEPRRAGLLRAALATGLPIVAFDVDAEDVAWMQAHPDEAFAYRERRMAEHIEERILDPDPAARVLIWVGYGHAQKWSPPGFPRMMAQHLWELADEEPFSAYQVTGEGRRRGVDVVVRHPEPRYENGRPDWLRSADRRSVQGTVDPPGEYLVQLHLASEGPSGTPIDQLLTPADGRFELLVPPGQYLLHLWSEDGGVTEHGRLAVGADVEDVRLRR